MQSNNLHATQIRIIFEPRLTNRCPTYSLPKSGNKKKVVPAPTFSYGCGSRVTERPNRDHFRFGAEPKFTRKNFRRAEKWKVLLGVVIVSFRNYVRTFIICYFLMQVLKVQPFTPSAFNHYQNMWLCRCHNIWKLLECSLMQIMDFCCCGCILKIVL